MFPWFLVAFLFVFAATGIGNGSTFRMIPADLAERGAEAPRSPGPPSARPPCAGATKQSSAVDRHRLGAVGASAAS